MKVLFSSLVLFVLLFDGQQALNAQVSIDSSEVIVADTSLTLLDSSNVELIQSLDSVKLAHPKREKREKTKYVNPNHSPKKAALLSLAFPGTGQIYNRKYWKLPIVYGGMGASLYFVITNAQSLKRNNALLTESFDPNSANAGNRTLIQSNRDIALRNVEISSIVFGVLYLANIIDAIVDAHLLNFDISDDISLKINPQILTVNNEVFPALGLNLRL